MCSGNKSCLAHQTEFIYKLSTNYMLFEIFSLKEKSFYLQSIKKLLVLQNFYMNCVKLLFTTHIMGC